jgi:hypothetical protein
MTPALSDLAQRLAGAGRITADDVLALRGVVYGAPELEVEDLEALVKLDAVAERAPAWGDFLAEAMTDFVVRQQDPRDYVDEAKARWAMAVIGDQPRLDSGLEALARMLEAADSAPECLEEFALDRTKAAVVAAGAVDAAHVALLRRLVFAAGSLDNVGVSRAEADVLFDIDAACRGGANDPAWPDFFAKAVAESLTAVAPFHAETRDAALQDEAWLTRRESRGDFFRALVRVPAFGAAVAAVDEVLHPVRDMAREWAAPEAAIETAEAAAAPITDDEARWLLGRLGEGQPSAAGAALIALLKVHASEASALLDGRFAASAGVSAAHDWTAPAFGQRRAKLA